jgi:D-tyrosyl-tRNA(Tyr) deacylase
MKAVLQRVSQASVTVDGKIIGQLKPDGKGGLMILLGVEQGDVDKDSSYLAQKIADMRIFADAEGKMNLSIKETGGSALVVSQFTLIADWRKGRRPGFSRAAAPAEGERLYLHFVEELRKAGLPVETGSFGADMKVSLTNDGPVTLLLESQIAKDSNVAAI